MSQYSCVARVNLKLFDYLLCITVINRALLSKGVVSFTSNRMNNETITKHFVDNNKHIKVPMYSPSGHRRSYRAHQTGNQIATRSLHEIIITAAMASQITSVSIVYSTVCSEADQIKHQSSASQTASNAENVSIWWRHHVSCDCLRNVSLFRLISQLAFDNVKSHRSLETPHLTLYSALCLLMD